MSTTPGDEGQPRDPYQPPENTPAGSWERPPPPGPGGWAQPAYGEPQPPPGYAPIGADHPQATTALVLGILGMVVCGVLSPFAWRIGKRAVEEIDASQGRFRGRGSAQAGYVLGLIGTILLGLAVLLVVVGVVVVFAARVSTTSP